MKLMSITSFIQPLREYSRGVARSRRRRRARGTESAASVMSVAHALGARGDEGAQPQDQEGRVHEEEGERRAEGPIARRPELLGDQIADHQAAGAAQKIGGQERAQRNDEDEKGE